MNDLITIQIWSLRILFLPEEPVPPITKILIKKISTFVIYQYSPRMLIHVDNFLITTQSIIPLRHKLPNFMKSIVHMGLYCQIDVRDILDLREQQVD